MNFELGFFCCCFLMRQETSRRLCGSEFESLGTETPATCESLNLGITNELGLEDVRTRI